VVEDVARAPEPAGRDARALSWYVTAIGFGGGLTLAAACWVSWRSDQSPGLAGPFPAAAAILLSFILASELLPIRWFRGRPGGELTGSWSFSYALGLIAPVGVALLTVAVTNGIRDLTKRRPVSRIVFNSGQAVVSVASALATVWLVSGRIPLPLQGPLTPRTVMATLAGGAVLLAVNAAVVSVVMTLHQGTGLRGVFRSALAHNARVDGLLVTMTPAFVVVARGNLLVLPLMLGAVYLIYKSTSLALSREHETLFDPDTDLPNRQLFSSHVEDARARAQRRKEEITVVALHIEGWDDVAARLGRYIADQVLVELARRLEGEITQHEAAARVNVDEFALLLVRTGDPEELHARVELIRDRLCEPCTVQGLPVAVRVRAGMAAWPDDAQSTNELLDHADVALYQARQGPETVQRYRTARDAGGHGRLSLLSDLQAAIEQEQLILHYQPKIDLATGAVTGAEALVRWEHPRLGLVPPGEFISLAEHTELMGPLTAYVLQRALSQCVEWRAQGLVPSVAVNASARNFHDLSFPTVVRDLLDRTGAEPEWLELEITENTVVEDTTRTMAVLGALRALGVGVAIDDFGTGYSSLAHLRDLPVDSVKIDRSFVQHMVRRANDAQIVRSIIELARNLGLRTVAEGVEDAEIQEVLSMLGCDEAQGYLIARPAEAGAMTAWLRASSQARARA
jgi:diguanylate cyclase (GGDEF)-like protein